MMASGGMHEATPYDVLNAVRGRLEDGSATADDHRAALQAITKLDDSEAVTEWLRVVQQGFGVVYSRRCERLGEEQA